MFLAPGGNDDLSHAARPDTMALDRIAIKVSPRVFGNRIRCLDDADALSKAVVEAQPPS